VPATLVDNDDAADPNLSCRYGENMTILVDAARWPWRGTTWCHLVSDSNFEELHEFASRLGSRRVGFQGDHYDIDVDTRLRAIELGAEEVESRELVVRLRSAGLRARPSSFEKWQLVTRGSGPLTNAMVGELAADASPHRLLALERMKTLAHSLEIRAGAAGWFVLERESSAAVIIYGEGPDVVGPGGLAAIGDDLSHGLFVRVEHHVSSRPWSVEVIVPSPQPQE